MPTPAPDFEITVELVTRLVADQHPDLAHLPIHGRVEGWDNVSMRLGDSLAVRLPRRRIAIELAEREQALLAPIAELSTLAYLLQDASGSVPPTTQHHGASSRGSMANRLRCLHRARRRPLHLAARCPRSMHRHRTV